MYEGIGKIFRAAVLGIYGITPVTGLQRTNYTYRHGIGPVAYWFRRRSRPPANPPRTMTLTLRDCLSFLRRLAPLGVLALLVGTTAATATARPQVDQVSFDRRADGMGYVIRFRTAGVVSGYSEPRRIGTDVVEVELFNVDLSRQYAHSRPDGPVLEYAEERRGGHVVFRFQLDPRYPVEASIYRDRLSTDILMGLTYRDDRPVALPLPSRPVTTTPAPAKGASPQATVNTAANTAANTAENTVRAEAERWRLDTIVIDAGHGGKDPGAQANGVREKDIVLGVARKVGDYVEENLGIRVVYTRRDDRFIELQDRGKMANASGGKLFVSIHVNAAADARASGTETYFLGMHKTEAARAVMQRENEVVKLESNPGQYTHLNEQALIRHQLLQSANMRKSQELAGLIEHQFAERVGRKSRGVKQAGFYVLYGASMPAILVELGFLTNPAEAAFLGSESGQAYMASAIYRAIKDYKEGYEKGLLVHTSN